jgi:small subunit ribosomal protein S1
LRFDPVSLGEGTMSDETRATVAETTLAAEQEAAAPTPSAEAGVTEQVEEATEGQAEASTDSSVADSNTMATAAENEGGQRVVRVLSVGQQVTGIVKRISEFGAFVDIGVGRDGLVHISELSARRIAKVTDVLQEGLEATFWIKKLDRDRNRISLTMIEPGTKTIRNMEKDDIVQGTVTRLMPYGAFVDIGIGRDALLHIREMGERYIAKPEDVVQVGEVIEARIIDISRRRARVDLSIKGLRPEPEPEPQPEVESQAAEPEPTPVEEPADNFADVEVLSPFAAALRRAEEASGIKLDVRKENKKSKRNDRYRSEQEDIIARTLDSGARR